MTFTDIASPTFAYRVILDHTRAATFLIADGVLPASKDQGYFVRRLIRRAVRYARNLNVTDNFMSSVAETFTDYYKDEYPELMQKRDIIISEIEKEENKFRKTLEAGLKEFDKISNANLNKISGEDAFNLLQSFGFPVELSLEIAKEKGITLDLEAFHLAKNAHSEASRSASVGKFKGGLGDDSSLTTELHSATHLLLAGLKKVLGAEVHQAGSNITTERLRFDFNFERKIEDSEIEKIENYVNNAISQGFKVGTVDMQKELAKSESVEGSFWEKYPDIVKVWTMQNEVTKEVYSRELCGGPHVVSSDMFKKEDGSTKVFKIAKQESASAGVRRIKGVLV